MKYTAYAFLMLSLSSFTMDDPTAPKGTKKEYSVQDLLDSKPNYQICILGECCLASLPDSNNKFTSVKGLENVDTIEKMNRINFDNNLISLSGSPFVGKHFKCTIFTLNGNGITTFNPTFFAGLNHLRELELKYNKISELKAEDLKSFHKLERLVLFGNPLSQDNLDELNQKFPNLTILS